ncbi:MAG: hypothetical protein KF860_17655, partial [Cyclobacteriaceae bacterium]|nr:hypothetical protein [Cyclobacteriaceae bacterium]
YSAIVEEVSTTPNGLSETIGAVENEKAEVNDGTDQGSKQKIAHSNEEKAKADFEMWAKIEPSLSKINLHPYIFISREKAIGFDSEIEMAAHLQEILSKLSSGSNIALQQAEKALESISFADASELFKTLENESRAIADVKTEPNTIKGLFRIIAKHPGLEKRLVNLVSSYPTQSLGVWAISQFTGLRTQPAIDAFNNFLISCSQQTENKPLNALAEQQLKK